MDLTGADVRKIGMTFLGIVAAQHALGHTNAASTASDYMVSDDPWQEFVLDVFRACNWDKDAERRAAVFIDEHGLRRFGAEAAGRIG